MSTSEPLSIRQLQVFVALIDQGSFTKAAKNLGLSQSTVSGHIADLERRVGSRLVGRDRTGVEPTAAGSAILRSARDALRAERNVRMAVDDLMGLLRGALMLGGSTIPANYVIPPVLAAFRERYEGIELHMRTGDSQEIVDFVRNGEIDVGVVGIRPRGRGLETIAVGGDELVLIAPPDHALACEARVEPATVMAHPMVLREEGSGTRRAMMRLLGDPSPADLDVVCEVGSTTAVKAAVRSGLGISFVSNLSIEDELAAGSLIAIPVQGGRASRNFFLVTREGSSVSPAGRAFCALMQELSLPVEHAR